MEMEFNIKIDNFNHWALYTACLIDIEKYGLNILFFFLWMN